MRCPVLNSEVESTQGGKWPKVLKDGREGTIGIYSRESRMLVLSDDDPYGFNIGESMSDGGESGWEWALVPIDAHRGYGRACIGPRR